MPHLIQVGNSLGLRIPKALLQQVGFKEDTNLVFNVTSKGLLISPEKQPREGWEEKFKTTKKSSKEKIILSEITNEFDRDEWKW